MPNSIEYGILFGKSCREFYELINSRSYCEQCRLKRIQFQELDKGNGKDNKKYLGIILPGFSSPKVMPMDIMIIADSIGGGRKGDFRPTQNLPLDEAIKHLGDYYLEDNIDKFHQYQMRKLLNWVNTDLKRNWVFTDLIKCFVYAKGKDGAQNIGEAIKYCKKYLDNQIDFFKPKIIVVLGSRVAKQYFRRANDQISTKSRGSMFKFHLKGHEYDVVYSLFPSMMTANTWVKDIDRYNYDEWFLVKQSIKKTLLSH
jgi:uracil-DNA glycosylase family 4